MNFSTWFQSSHSSIPFPSAEAVLRLVAEGSTVPFIARYRKEQTGGLDEVAIQKVIDASENWAAILKRQQFIVGEIEHQKKLTPELKDKIFTTFVLETLEDIYLPYKVKRKTKAAAARDAGLEPFADWLWDCAHGLAKPEPAQTPEVFALAFYNAEKDIKDAAAAINGAQDILIERLSEIQEIRQKVREAMFQTGCVKSIKGDKAKPNSKYENYFSFHEPIQSLLKPENSHRYLAVRRGWMEEELVLSLGGKPDEVDGKAGDSGFEAALLKEYENAACTEHDFSGAPILKKCARLALKAHVLTSIENEAHKALKDVADEAAISVFAENVRKLLLAAPFGPKAVLGVDPGIRTGCKVAIVDDSGKYIASTVIHLQSKTEKEAAQKALPQIITNGHIRAIAVGNGTAGRETETFLRGVVREAGLEVPVVMVSESGASVYSASEIAREEFPDLDLTVRGAISIARRLQDPLSELVKVDPKSIGVGQYQHDVGERPLKRSLDLVVDSCVNQVGVNLNTASYHLLSHVAGIGPGLAKNIVEFRGKKGLFKSRKELLEVGRFTQKAFEQAAGFLRIPEADDPLDNTGVHPERYSLLETQAKKLGKTIRDLMGSGVQELKRDKDFRKEVGDFTFEDIIRELEKPGRDPRDQFVAFQYREDIHELKDLKPGMTCPGIVTNVTNFGAFVDIGVHQDGLVHVSQLADRFVKDPREVVSPGDRVQVRVVEVNLDKTQIALTMRSEKPAAQPKAESQSRAPRPGKSRSERKPKTPPLTVSDGPRVAPRTPGTSPVAPKRPPQVFNNAFAGLASLKSSLKK